MSSTKNLLAAALIAACAISQPVLADVTESATLPVLNTLALESTDLNFAFEQTSQPLQMATLSEQEMKETEGAVLPWAVQTGIWTVGGAGAGGAAYLWATPATNWTLGNFGRSMGAGATAGFYGSPLMTRVLTPLGSMAVGAFGGASWFTW